MIQECLEKAGAKEGKIKRGVSEKHTCGKSGTGYRSSKKAKSDNSRITLLSRPIAVWEIGSSRPCPANKTTRTANQTPRPRY